jgi:hypothetical protein
MLHFAVKRGAGLTMRRRRWRQRGDGASIVSGRGYLHRNVWGRITHNSDEGDWKKTKRGRGLQVSPRQGKQRHRELHPMGKMETRRGGGGSVLIDGRSGGPRGGGGPWCERWAQAASDIVALQFVAM